MIESKNFYTSLLTLVALFFGYFGIDLPNSPDEIVAAGEGLGFVGIFTAVLLPNFFNPILKIIESWKDHGFNWGFITSPNFWTQASTTVLMAIQLFTPLTTFWIVLITQALNFLYHLITKKKEARLQGMIGR